MPKLDRSIYLKNNAIFGIGYAINHKIYFVFESYAKVRVSTYIMDIWKCQSSPEHQFLNLSIRAQHPPVLEQNTRIPKMIQHKTKDIFVDPQNTNAE